MTRTKKPAAGPVPMIYVGGVDAVVVALPSGPVTVERGQLVELDPVDAAALSGNPDWVVHDPSDSSEETD